MLDAVYKRSRQFSEEFQNEKFDEFKPTEQILVPGQLPNDILRKVKNGIGADGQQVGAGTEQNNILDDPLEAHGQRFGANGLETGGSDGGIFDPPRSRSQSIHNRIEINPPIEVPTMIQLDEIVDLGNVN